MADAANLLCRIKSFRKRRYWSGSGFLTCFLCVDYSMVSIETYLLNLFAWMA